MEVQDSERPRWNTFFLLSAGDQSPQVTAITNAIERHRYILYGVVAVLFLLAFNGEWRVRPDSAMYRGLGHSLATGKGYKFGNYGGRSLYAGLPVMLAGLEKVFGPSPLPPIVLITAMAIACIVLSYKLTRLRFDRWVAICVACGVGINGQLLRRGNEILTDVPFLLGVLMALYGWELLRQRWSMPSMTSTPSASAQRWWPSLVWLIAGLMLAATTRPTFWALAIAWLAACAWGLIVGPNRRFYLLCFSILAAIWIAALLADPRVRCFNPLGGG